jgi:AcrR family transcriptional regulator
MSDKAKQILKTAEKLFAAGRYHEVTLDDICHEAGVGKGTIYRYFKDKEDLFWQVILTGQEELTQTIERVGKEECDAPAGLRAMVRETTEFYRDRGELFGLVWSQEFRGSEGRRQLRREWRQRNERSLAVAKQFIERGVEQGIYGSPLSSELAARFFLGMLRTALHHWHQMPADVDWPTTIVELFESGLRVRK